MKYFIKIFKSLDRGEKNKLLYCYFLILVASGLEFISISTIIPAINIIVDNTYQQKFLSFMEYESLRNYFETDFIFKIISIIIIIFLFKFIFSTYLFWYRSTFNQKLIVRIKNSIFQKYLSQNYIFFLKNHSSKLIRNLSSEVNLFVGTINNLISVLLESSILLTLLIIVYLYQPLESLFVIFLIFLVGLLIYLPIKNILNKWGIVRQKNDGENLKNIQHGISGIKDIKINKKEDFFLKKFNNSSFESAKAGKIRSFLVEFPKIWLELIISLSIFISIFFFLNENYGLNKILASLGIYAAVALRSLTSINRLLVAFQGLVYAKPVVDIIYQELKLFETVFKKKHINKLDFNKNIELKNLSFKYENKQILNNINLEVNKKEIIGIIGESGAGKTTFINLISGLLQAQEGETLVDKKKIDFSSPAWLELIGYTSQNTYIFDDTIEKNISMSEIEHINKKEISDLLKVVCLDKIEQIINPNLKNQNLGESGSKLSVGQIQRIGIARALYQNPSILILDEATSALDLELEAKIIENLSQFCRERNITTFIVSHRKKPLEYCDRIINLKSKEIKVIN